jgi:hypothetical protein
MLQITLQTPLTAQVTEPFLPEGHSSFVTTVSTLTLAATHDNPANKVVEVSFFEIPRPVRLWTGEHYTAAGQWTQEQVEAATSELIALRPEQVVYEGFNHIELSHEEKLLEASSRTDYLSGKFHPVRSWVIPTSGHAH